MEKSVTYIGYWWLPNDFENKFQGTLVFEANGDVVLNFLKDATSINFDKIYRNRTKIPTLFGIAKDESSTKESSFKLLNALHEEYITSINAISEKKEFNNNFI